MARKVGQIVGRGRHTWLVRVFNGRDPENKKRKYLNQTIHGGLRDAQAHLNKMLGERDRGRNLDSSKQTLNQYLDRWLEVCAKRRVRAKSLQDYEGLLPLRAFSTWPEGGGACLRVRHPNALPRPARPKLVGPLDPLHPRSLAIGYVD